MRALRACSVVLASLSLCCVRVDPRWFTTRELLESELVGTWSLPQDATARQYLSDLLEVPLVGRRLVLHPGGQCSLDPPLPEPPAVAAFDLRHHANGCRWKTVVRQLREARASVAAVDVGVVYDGRLRGITFLARVDEGQVQLWFEAGGQARERTLFGRVPVAK